MKKLLIILVWLICASTMCAQTEFTIDNLRYRILNDSTVKVEADFRLSGYKDIIIPESVSYNENEYIVTEIGANLSGISYKINVNSITIPSSIKKIGQGAFDGCRISSVHIADLKSWCEIEFGKPMSKEYYTGFDSYVVYTAYSNPLYYAQHLCIDGKEVKDLVIPDSITTVKSYAFQHCKSLTSVTIMSADIENDAFKMCSNLETVTLGELASRIGRYAFSNCSNLVNVYFSDSLDFIDSFAFEDCYSLENISLPNTLRYIEDYAFWGCTELYPPMLPDSLEYLGDCAFGKCKPIRNLYLPSKVKSFESAFNMDSLETITVDIRNPYIDSRNNCNAVIETQTNTLLWGCKNSFIPDGVREIVDLSHLPIDSIVIPSSVELISSNAFSGCDKLAYIEFQEPDSILTIYGRAFANCTSLKELFFPNKIQFVIFPDIINFIGNSYEHFMNCTNLKTVTLPSTMRKIPEKMFYGCTSLTTVNFPDGLTKIGENAFFGCPLDTIRIPASVVKIDEAAFMGCAATAKSISVDSGNTCYDSRNDCNMIIETAKDRVIQAGREEFVTVPEGIKSLGHYAFVNAHWLKYILCPETLESVGEKTFKGCSRLEKIIFRGYAPLALSILQETTNVDIREGQYEDIEVVIGKRWSSTQKVKGDAYFWLNFSYYMDKNIDELIKEFVAAVPSIESEKPTIRLFSNMLRVSNAEGLPVKVYSINGIKIYESANYSGGQIPLEKGMYIVQIDEKTEKIANW